MKTKEIKKSEVTKWQQYKWVLEDMTGLLIHKFIAAASTDPKVKELYQEMREALIEEGDQPKATQISNEIRAKIMENTQRRLN